MERSSDISFIDERQHDLRKVPRNLLIRLLGAVDPKELAKNLEKERLSVDELDSEMNGIATIVHALYPDDDKGSIEAVIKLEGHLAGGYYAEYGRRNIMVPQ